jgi:hypothetical protein
LHDVETNNSAGEKSPMFMQDITVWKLSASLTLQIDVNNRLCLSQRQA